MFWGFTSLKTEALWSFETSESLDQNPVTPSRKARYFPWNFPVSNPKRTAPIFTEATSTVHCNSRTIIHHTMQLVSLISGPLTTPKPLPTASFYDSQTSASFLYKASYITSSGIYCCQPPEDTNQLDLSSSKRNVKTLTSRSSQV